uniref:CAZy families GH109 protein n=1 Tax=uncultured Arenibacter sp. TaxID=358598 RepID=A0A060CEB1_9FLAO|nr:CAZy families GH109 protein [uncultured Arenibacter sp.]
MKAGAHAFTEVPMAYTMKDLWEIIDTSEATGRHCMMMENVNYGREELVYLNMVRQGVIGELLHGEAAYIHELRRPGWRTAIPPVPGAPSNTPNATATSIPPTASAPSPNT